MQLQLLHGLKVIFLGGPTNHFAPLSVILFTTKPAMQFNKPWFLSLLLVFAAVQASADAALLLEEPYGKFGALNPTGHAAVYLPRICADTPVL